MARPRGGALRLAQGVVTRLDAPVKALCGKCEVQSAFTFEGDAGPGFSGGPVWMPPTASWSAIIFGYVDERRQAANRLIYAYTMDRVTAELRRRRSVSCRRMWIRAESIAVHRFALTFAPDISDSRPRMRKKKRGGRKP